MTLHRRALLAYLALCLLLGGASAAGLLANLVLQLCGAGLLGWTLLLPRPAPLPRPFRAFLLAAALLAVIQFVPLPFGLWAGVPGRADIARDLLLLDVPDRWRPLSLSPWHSLMSLAWAIPACAVLAAARLHPGIGRGVARLLLAMGLLSLPLGLAQRVRGSGYLYAVTNYGEAPGFFANANHQASFLLVALLWIGAGLTAVRPERGQTRIARIGTGASMPLFVVGLLANNSLAVDGLLLGVIALLAANRATPRLPAPVVAASLLLAAIGLAFLVGTGRLTNDLAGAGLVPGISRRDFLRVGTRMLATYFPLGSGLGSFALAYPLFEDPAQVGPVFVNHAHDDLLELLVEGGVFGLAAMATFLAWFAPAAWAAWRARDPFRRAAALAVTVELAHSLVDYPLRTAALSALTAFGVAVLLTPEKRSKPSAP